MQLVRAAGSTWLAIASVVLLTTILPTARVRAGSAEDTDPFAPGLTVREYGGRKYEIVVPKELHASKAYSLILAISVNGRNDIAGSFAAIADDGWITCAPKTRYTNKGAGENWASNEGAELIELVEHLRKVLPIGEGRVHTVAVEDWAGFFPFVAFAKDERFVSATFAGRCAFRGGSPPDRAKKEMGVLVLGTAPLEQLPADQRIAPALAGKVRSVEVRSDTTDPVAAYPHYWRGVMEGRFTPGHDLSLAWNEAKDRDAVAKLAASAGKPALLYVYSAAEAAKAAAKNIQNVVFLDADVREAAVGLLPVKLDRHVHEELFAEFGLKTTPALVVVAATLKPLAKLEGDVTTAAALKVLRPFAPRKRGPR